MDKIASMLGKLNLLDDAHSAYGRFAKNVADPLKPGAQGIIHGKETIVALDSSRESSS